MGQRTTAALAAGVLAALYGSVASADFEYSVEAGAGHSDNITRVSTGESDEAIATAGVDLTWIADRPRLDADVAVNADYYDYLDDTYESEVAGTAQAELVFGLIPERFTWLVQDSFGQERSDPFAAVTPETREDVNYFTTGPDFTLRLGQTGQLRLFGRYSMSEYERSPLDGDRKSAGFGLGRRSGESVELSVNAITERIEFDESGSVDYDRDAAYVQYSLEGTRTQVLVDAGYTWLEREGGDKSGNPLVNVSISRNLSSASTLSLSFGTQLTDSSDALRGAIDGPPVNGTSGVTASADPFENRNAALAYSFTRNRTSLGLSVNWDDDSYETQTLLDRTIVQWTASMERRMTRTLTLGLLASLTDEEFDNVDATADDLRFGATLSWQFARTLGLRLLVERFDRDSSEAVGSYVENRAFLTIFYRPAGSTP